MTSDLERRTAAPALSPSEQRAFATDLSGSSLVPKEYRGNQANVLLAIGLGQSMGLSPSEALLRIDVIQGKPTASAELIASNVRRAGHKLRVRVDEASQSVTAIIVRADDPEFEHKVTRDAAWARSMGLMGRDQYKRQLMTMLQWRAITAVARLACSEALYGVAYTPDELQDMGERPRGGAPRASVDDLLAPSDRAAPHEPETVDAEFVDDGPDRDQLLRVMLEEGAARGMSPNAVSVLAMSTLAPRRVGGWDDLTVDDIAAVRVAIHETPEAAPAAPAPTEYEENPSE